MENTIEIGQKQYHLKFPSLNHIKVVGNLLEYEPLTGQWDKVDWSKILADPSATMKVIRELLVEEVTDEILDEVTTADFVAMVSAFFLKGRNPSVKFGGGLESFNDILNPTPAKSPRPDSSLTSSSSDHPEPTRKQLRGAGETGL